MHFPLSDTDVRHVENQLRKPSVVQPLGGKMKPLRAHPSGVVHKDVTRVAKLEVATVLVQVCATTSLAANLQLVRAIGVDLERSNTGIAAAEWHSCRWVCHNDDDQYN